MNPTSKTKHLYLLVRRFIGGALKGLTFQSIENYALPIGYTGKDEDPYIIALCIPLT